MSKKLHRAAAQPAATDARQRDPQEDHVLTIEAVAKMFRMSRFALRLYEWRGLIHRHNNGSEQVYSWCECERIALIVKAKRAGLKLRQIAPVVKAMCTKAPPHVFKAGRERCLDLLASMKARSDALADVLGELHRVDWELSARLAANGAGGSAR